jgi:hypothetical protein
MPEMFLTLADGTSNRRRALSAYRARMDHAATIQFTDRASHDEALAIVRATDSAVALALSVRNDGDLEVVLPIDACNELIAALQRAVSPEP